MNYRHAYHAGNFGDVLKHALLVALIRALQQKEKGFLYLDTHAGRGSYDLEGAGRGLSLERKPEWPDGIGRVWDAPDLPDPLADYLAQVRDYDREKGNLTGGIRFYPGSPAIAARMARPQDRLALCERQPDECAALKAALASTLPGLAGRPARVSFHDMDGYEALRAMLPPPERRALVLIDPPFEAADEAEQLSSGLANGLRRAPAATFAIWYPFTERVRPEDFFRALIDLKPPPTIVIELKLAEPRTLPVAGCAVTIINPPWKFEIAARSVASRLADILGRGPGAGWEVTWLVPE